MNLFKRLGLQFFAESESAEGAEGGALDDGANQPADEGFLDALEPEGGEPEDMQTGGQPRDQPPAEEEPPAQTPPEQEPPAPEQTPPPQMMQMDLGGRAVSLPADAVQAVSAALGMDAAGLLQKGMAYDGKAGRELAVLRDYAQAAGMSMEDYVGYLERERDNQMIAAEQARLQAQYPDAAPEILHEMAKNTMNMRRMEAEQNKARQEQRTAALREHIEQQARAIQQAAQARDWNAYVRAAGITAKEQIPKELVQMVVREGISPLTAYYRMQAESARKDAENQAAARQKEEGNRRESIGSMAGSMAENDQFLEGLFG